MYFPNQGGKYLSLLGDNYFKPFVEHEEFIPRLQLCHERHTEKDVRSPVNPIQCITSLRSPEVTSTSTSDTKVPIPVFQGAVIVKRDRGK